MIQLQCTMSDNPQDYIYHNSRSRTVTGAWNLSNLNNSVLEVSLYREVSPGFCGTECLGQRKGWPVCQYAHNYRVSWLKSFYCTPLRITLAQPMKHKPSLRWQASIPLLLSLHYSVGMQAIAFTWRMIPHTLLDTWHLNWGGQPELTYTLQQNDLV